MKNKLFISRMLIGLSILLSTQALYAWHNDFSIVNNTDDPILFSIATDQGGAHPDPLCSDGKAVPPNRSCHIELTDSFKFPEGTGHKGTVTLTKKNGETCRLHYKYILNELSYSKKRSVELKIESCTPGFDSKGLNFVSDQIKTMPRPMLYLLDLPLIVDKLQKSTESFSTADCADPTTGEEFSDNCVVVTPTDPNLTNGSSFTKALTIQNNIDRYEPLSRAQWIGTHNSAIGPAYTKSKQLANMSFSDPNNIYSIPKQLDAGVRMIEFDVLWDRGAVKLCHNHLNIPKPLDKLIANVMCDDNAALSQGVSDLKTWLASNPDKLVVVLLDINQKLEGHEADIEKDLAPLEDKIFSPKDAHGPFSKLMQGKALPAHTLPTGYISKDDILKTGKQVIFVASADDSYLSAVKYLFLHNYSNQSDLLYQNGIEQFMPRHTLCLGAQKYKNVQAYYDGDPGHFNIWRTNGDRTVIGYLNNANGNTSGYNDYASLATIKKFRKCPFNIMSINMLGFTCNQSNINDCKYNRGNDGDKPLDPRLVAFLWSWDRGYPVQADGHTNHQAYIIPNENKTNIRFQNTDSLKLIAKRVLCHVNAVSANNLGPDEWFTAPFSKGQSADSICEKLKGVFATPVTSYQMDDVWLRLKSVTGELDGPILINYRYDINHGWLANSGKALPAPKTP